MPDKQDRYNKQSKFIKMKGIKLFEEEARKRLQLSKGQGVKGTQLIAELKGEAREQTGKIINVGKTYISDAKKLKAEHPEVIEDINYVLYDRTRQLNA